jgi:hypothetical protein
MSREVLIGEDQLQKLEAVAEAASDLKLAHGDAEFARLNGGIDKLQRDLNAKVSEWESFMSPISGD